MIGFSFYPLIECGLKLKAFKPVVASDAGDFSTEKVSGRRKKARDSSQIKLSGQFVCLITTYNNFVQGNYCF